MASKVIPSLIKHSTQAGNDMGVGIDDSKTPNAIRALYEAGITTFDTAEAYGPGGTFRTFAKGDHRAANRLFQPVVWNLELLVDD